MQVNKTVKRTGISLLVVAVLLTSLHLFVVYRARQILNFIVMQASDGQYMVKTKKVRFRYNPLAISATGFQLLPTNTTISPTWYTVTADSVFLEVTKLWPLIASKNFSLGRVHIIHPVVKVFDTDTTPVMHKPLNVVLSDIQHALVTTLSAFNVEECKITNAGLAYQQSVNGRRPLSVNHIFLKIDNLHTIDKNGGDSLANFQADIKLFIDKPFIELPDSSSTVYINNLMLDTKANVFTVNRFSLFQANDAGTIDSIKLSNIKLQHFNWPRWLKEGLIEIDSLHAYDGATFFDFSGTEIFTLNNNKKIVKKRIVAVPLLVHSMNISKISYSLRAGSSSGPLNIQLNGDSLGLGELSLQNDAISPLKIGNLSFTVTGYTNNYENNLNESSFEKLIIDHNDLVLKNYYRSLNGKRKNSVSSIAIPTLRVINFSLNDLLESRLQADKLILENPQLVIDMQQSEKKRDADATVAAIAASLQPSLDIKQLSIRDASIVLLPRQKTAGKVTIENLNTEIDARQLLDSKSVMDIIGSATALSTSGFNVVGDDMNLQVQRSKLNNTQNGIYLQKISGNIGQQLQLDLNGITINDNNNKFDITKLQRIQLDDVNIESGKISINANHPKMFRAGRKTLSFDISKIHSGPLVFEWIKSDKKIYAENIKLNGTNILVEKNNTTWGAVDLTTGTASFNSPKSNITAAYLLLKQPGIISAYSVNYKPLSPASLNNIDIPVVTIKMHLVNTSSAALKAEEVTLYKPAISISKSLAGSQKQPLQLPDFSIDKLRLDQPVFTINSPDSSELKFFSTNNGSIVLQNVNSNKQQHSISAAGVRMQLLAPQFQFGKKVYEPAAVSLTAQQIFLAENGTFQMMIDTAEIKSVSLNTGADSTIKIESASAGLSNYKFISSDTLSLRYLIKHANWWSSAVAVKKISKQFSLAVYNPYLTVVTPFFSMDSLTLIPLLEKDSFFRSQPYEKDFNTLHLGYTEMRNWRLTGKANERKLTAQYLLTDKLNFLTEKDKTHGPDTVKYRPLLANSFKKIPIFFSIDTVQVTNGYVKHTVLAERSKRQANIFFSEITGYLYNVKNTNINTLDTLRLRVHGQIMGEGDLLLGFKQSYTDSMQGFAMRARMGRMNLSVLNPLLVPIVSVKIDRGLVDSMLLAVGANDVVAYGSMDMRYHNLRLSILKKGEKKYFLSSFFNWLINIPVRSSDDAKKNPLYLERLRNKGIYNYWSKIAISGLLTNLGIKRDKRQVRKYNKAMRRDVPAVPTEL